MWRWGRRWGGGKDEKRHRSLPQFPYWYLNKYCLLLVNYLSKRKTHYVTPWIRTSSGSLFVDLTDKLLIWSYTVPWNTQTFLTTLNSCLLVLWLPCMFHLLLFPPISSPVLSKSCSLMGLQCKYYLSDALFF
jgi:hypothetical protein